jgi:hypothetical protein
MCWIYYRQRLKVLAQNRAGYLYWNFVHFIFEARYNTDFDSETPMNTCIRFISFFFFVISNAYTLFALQRHCTEGVF